MKIVRTVSACAATIVFAMSIAGAQQAIKGVVTDINEPAGTISIQQTTSGTTGAAGGAATNSYKVQDGLLFNALHLGDKVAFSAEDIGGFKTITRLDRE
jgi:Cu/Ag efflux protein CusF